MFDNEAQIIRKFNFEFWPDFDKEFQTYVLEAMQDNLKDDNNAAEKRETFVFAS